MTDYKLWLGYISTAIALSTYVMYLWAVYKGQAKPHAFTWLVWGFLSAIGFVAVLVSGGESGAWVLGANVVGCWTIAAVGFYQRHVTYDTYDWYALFGAFIGVFLWWLTDNPLAAVILISLSDGLGVIPTLRKAYRLPYEENALTFVVSVFYYIIALGAMESFHITNWLYHVVVMVSDITLVCLILIRRKQLKK